MIFLHHIKQQLGSSRSLHTPVSDEQQPVQLRHVLGHPGHLPRPEPGELGVEQLGTASELDIRVEDDELVERQHQVVEWRHVE